MCVYIYICIYIYIYICICIYIYINFVCHVQKYRNIYITNKVFISLWAILFRFSVSSKSLKTQNRSLEETEI